MSETNYDAAPCPFCGSSDTGPAYLFHKGKQAYVLFWHCSECLATGPSRDERQAGVDEFILASWNKRAPVGVDTP